MAEKIMVSIDKKLLSIVDDKVESIGLGANRSAFISEALVYFMKVKYGLAWKKRRN